MTVRSLTISILKKGRWVQDIEISADPDDTPAVQASLKNWLEGGRWDPKLWPLFAAEVRIAHQMKLLKTVRL